MSVVHMNAVSMGDRRGGQIPGTGVTGGCLPFCRCWDLNQGPMEEEPLLLTLELLIQLIACVYNLRKEKSK